MPPGLLAQLRSARAAAAQRRQPRPRRRRRASARAAARSATRRGELRGGARLDVLATLRAAAPWQPLRRREARRGRPRAAASHRACGARISASRASGSARATTTIFVVDASGSSALHRLAEAKGAVELLLAECYVRRDQVALVAFRGRGAELLLPPTRSLARAKRSLAGLPGGGGTPLAAGLDAAVALAEPTPRARRDAGRRRC